MYEVYIEYVNASQDSVLYADVRFIISGFKRESLEIESTVVGAYNKKVVEYALFHSGSFESYDDAKRRAKQVVRDYTKSVSYWLTNKKEEYANYNLGDYKVLGLSDYRKMKGI
jgi:hypothetical protein